MHALDLAALFVLISERPDMCFREVAVAVFAGKLVFIQLLRFLGFWVAIFILVARRHVV